MRKRTTVAWTGTSCSKMLGLIPADVVQRSAILIRQSVCMGRTMGPCTVDDENLAGGLGQATRLRQSLETCEWSRVRCCGLDDAFRMEGAVGHGIWDAHRGSEHAVHQDGPGSARVTESQHWLWLAGHLSLLHSSSPCSTCALHENTWHEVLCSLSSWARCARKTWNGWSVFHWIVAASFVKRLWAPCGTDVTSAPHLQNSDAATARTSIWTNGSTACRY